MTGTTGSNVPEGWKPLDRVRHLQCQLWIAAKRPPGRRFHALLDRAWRADNLQEAGQRAATLVGTPQGGVLLPLLANIYLHVRDRIREDRCAHLGTLVCYADDLMAMCATPAAPVEDR